MDVFSGRGRAPKVREAGNARGKRRGAELFKQQSERSSGEISPWFAPARQPARVSANELSPGYAREFLELRSISGRNLWQQ
jgi:hypothetical protein